MASPENLVSGSCCETRTWDGEQGAEVGFSGFGMLPHRRCSFLNEIFSLYWATP